MVEADGDADGKVQTLGETQHRDSDKEFRRIQGRVAEAVFFAAKTESEVVVNG